jgi:hypothetical protein
MRKYYMNEECNEFSCFSQSNSLYSKIAVVLAHNYSELRNGTNGRSGTTPNWEMERIGDGDTLTNLDYH